MTKIKKVIGEETISQIFKRGRKASRYYINSVRRSGELVKGFRTNTLKQNYLRYLMENYGVPYWIPACNAPARRLLGKHLAKAMRMKYHHEFKLNGMELYHVTLAFEDFLTGDKITVIDWPKIKKRVSTLMRRLGKDFIGMGEIDVLLNKNFMIDGVSQGRVLCPHFHILFWTSKPIQIIKLSQQLSKPFAQNADGMKVVKITRCNDSDADVTRLASYLFKAPQGGKTLWMNKEFDGEGALQSVKISQRDSGEKNHRMIVFSRLAEILSHTEMKNLMISGGEGNALKFQLLKILVETNKLLGTPPPKEFGYKRTLSFWKNMRSGKYGSGYLTPTVKF